MAVIVRTIDNHLQEIAALAAGGHQTAAGDVVDDLMETLFALVAAGQPRYPTGTRMGGENVGGQFAPKGGGSGGGGSAGGGGGSDASDGGGGSSGSGGGAGAGNAAATVPAGTTESVTNLDKTLSNAGPGPIKDIKSVVAGTLAAAGAGVAAVGAYVEQKGGDTFESMSAALDDLETKATEALETVKADKAKAAAAAKGLIDKARNLSVSIQIGKPPEPPAPEAKDWFEALGKQMDDWVAAKGSEAVAQGEKAVQAAKDFQKGIETSRDNIIAKAEEKAGEVKAKADQLVAAANGKVGDTAASVTSWANSVKAQATGLKDQFTTMASENAADIASAYEQDVEAMLTAVDGAMATAQDVIDQAKSDVAAAGEAAQKLKTDIQNLPQTVKSGVEGAINSTKEKANMAVADAKTMATETREIVAKEYGESALRGEVKQLVQAVGNDVKGTAEDAAALLKASTQLAKLTAEATMASYWAALKGVPLEQSKAQARVMKQIEKLRSNPVLSDSVDQAAANSKRAYEKMREVAQKAQKARVAIDAELYEASQFAQPPNAGGPRVVYP